MIYTLPKKNVRKKPKLYISTLVSPCMRTRDLIIEILGTEWPLSARMIHNRLSARGLKSYHTVYEILQDLVAKKVLIKNKQLYFISKAWLDTTIEDLESIRKRYNTLGSLHIKDKNNFKFTVFSLKDLFAFITKNVDSHFFGKPPYSFFMKCNYPWGGYYSKQDVRILQQIIHTQSLVIVKHNTRIARAIAKFYSKMGAKVSLGHSIESFPDTLVINNSVIQVYFPKKLRTIFDDLLGDKARIDLSKVRAYRKVEEMHAPILITVTRDRTLASGMADEIRSESELKP